MPKHNKLHTYVKQDDNGWLMLHNKEFRMQLSGDSRKDGFLIVQAANALGKKEFMKDLTEILKYMESQRWSVFTVYKKESTN